MDYNFRNLVFEGGGIIGIAYAGALDVLEEKKIMPSITRVGGTSAGAIVALMVGLSYSNDDIKDMLWNTDFKTFLDDSNCIVTNTIRVIKKYGWYKGHVFKSWIEKIIEQKTGNPNSTFQDIFDMKKEFGFRDLYFIGTNLSTRFSEIFSYEHTPNMKVSDALRISMSIPIFFSAVRTSNKDVYVDGGVIENYPIQLFDKKKYLDESIKNNQTEYIYNYQTLGFRLDCSNDISVFEDHKPPKHYKISKFSTFVKFLANTFIDSQAHSFLESHDWDRTLYISNMGVKITDFDISDKQKKELLKSGETYALKYFKWYDDPSSSPNNKL